MAASLLLGAIAGGSLVSAKDDPKKTPIEPEPLPDMVQAGIVVSITEDFLLRGQNELLEEFVNKINRLSDDVVYEVAIADYIPEYADLGTVIKMY